MTQAQCRDLVVQRASGRGAKVHLQCAARDVQMRDAKVLTRFDVTSDTAGKITGTFAAGTADTSSLVDSLQGGAFNGLTLVGGFPDYKPAGTAFIFR